MMNKIRSITAKELLSIFRSPMAFLVILITITIFNVFFYMIMDEGKEATLRDVFAVMEFMFVFIAPLATMRSLAEEKMNGTMEFLMTTPTTNTALVIGKYLGSLIFLSSIIFLTLSYYAILAFFAPVDHAVILSGYLGIWLEVALFSAIGVMVSSWTRYQMAAAIGAYAVIFGLYFSISFVEYTQGPLQEIIRYSGTWSHLQNLSGGLINTSDIIYYLSGIVFCLLMARISIENRLWR